MCWTVMGLVNVRMAKLQNWAKIKIKIAPFTRLSSSKRTTESACIAAGSPAGRPEPRATYVSGNYYNWIHMKWVSKQWQCHQFRNSFSQIRPNATLWILNSLHCSSLVKHQFRAPAETETQFPASPHSFLPSFLRQLKLCTALFVISYSSALY